MTANHIINMSRKIVFKFVKKYNSQFSSIRTKTGGGIGGYFEVILIIYCRLIILPKDIPVASYALLICTKESNIP